MLLYIVFDKNNTPVRIEVTSQAHAKLAIEIHDIFCNEYRTKQMCDCNAQPWREVATKLTQFMLTAN